MKAMKACSDVRRETGDRRGKMGNGVGLKKQVCKVQFSRASVSLRP